MNPAFLRHNEAAKYCGISPSLLAKQIRLGTGPPRRRIGRVVVYAVVDLIAWLESKVA